MTFESTRVRRGNRRSRVEGSTYRKRKVKVSIQHFLVPGRAMLGIAFDDNTEESNEKERVYDIHISLLPLSVLRVRLVIER